MIDWTIAKADQACHQVLLIKLHIDEKAGTLVAIYLNCVAQLALCACCKLMDRIRCHILALILVLMLILGY